MEDGEAAAAAFAGAGAVPLADDAALVRFRHVHADRLAALRAGKVGAYVLVELGDLRGAVWWQRGARRLS